MKGFSSCLCALIGTAIAFGFIVTLIDSGLNSFFIALICLGIPVIVLVIGASIGATERDMENNAKNERARIVEDIERKIWPEYKAIEQKYGLFQGCDAVFFFSDPDTTYLVNTHNDELCLMKSMYQVALDIEDSCDIHRTAESYAGLIHIPIVDIHHYRLVGDVSYETSFSGGGGGGVSIGGAVVGGLIAGDAGAIIGSRKKNDPIVSTTLEHDDRRTLLFYQDENANKLSHLEFDGDAYVKLLGLLPEKDIHLVSR